jgi:hypothetical protein
MAAMELPEALLRRLEQAAVQRDLSPADLLDQLLRPYESPGVEPEKVAEEVRRVMLRIYDRARKYWREQHDPRARLTDEEMDDQFWLIDYDGIPRMKSEQGMVDVPPSGLEILAELGREANLPFGRHDIVENSREILNEEFANYLLNRTERDYDAE